MSKPTDDFWMAAGIAVILFAFLGGMALLVWAVKS
jgi:hypothetical protein